MFTMLVDIVKFVTDKNKSASVDACVPCIRCLKAGLMCAIKGL